MGDKDKEKGDVFKQFHDSFSKLEGHFHVLEQRIPVETQMEYFKHSELKRKQPVDYSLTDTECEEIYALLQLDAIPAEDKKDYLTQLALSKSVKAYRLLEQYAREPHPSVANWTYLALMESRISLESELSDEKQIYISTGLGGREDKLRFYVLLLSVENQPFQDYQRNVIEREFTFALPKQDCEIEYLKINANYVELLFLISVKADIKAMLDQVIAECNQYGSFLADLFTITNVKELTNEEIEDILRRNGDSQAGN